MYRVGFVSARDIKTHRVRVKFPARGDLESYWLEVLVGDSETDKEFRLPTMGATVAVMLDEREESGCVLGAIYTGANLPTNPSETVRRVTFGDGTIVEYDRASHRMYVSTVGPIEITTTGNVKVTTTADAIVDAVNVSVDADTVAVDAPTVTVTADTTTVTSGNVHLDGTIKVAGGAESVALATKTGDALTALKNAIAGGVPAPLDGGAALKTSIMAALAAWPPSVAASKLTSD